MALSMKAPMKAAAKRGRSASAAPAMKKAKAATPMKAARAPPTKKPESARSAAAAKCVALAKAVRAFVHVPPDVTAMLGDEAILKNSLAVPAEERHEYSQQVVRMVAQVLKTAEAGLEARKKEIATAISEADADRATKEGDVQGAEQALTARKEAMFAASSAFKEADDQQRAAKRAKEEAWDEQKAFTAEHESSTQKASQVEEIIGLSATLKSAAQGPAADALAQFKTKWTTLSFDSTLLASVLSAMTKQPEERGEFDNIVFDQVDRELSKQLTKLQESIGAGEATKAERAAAVEAAEKALAAADDRVRATDDAEQAATRDEKEAENALKVARRTVRACGPTLKQQQANLKAAQAALKDFHKHTLSTFNELEAFTMVLPSQHLAQPEEDETARPTAADEASAVA